MNLNNKRLINGSILSNKTINKVYHDESTTTDAHGRVNEDFRKKIDPLNFILPTSTLTFKSRKMMIHF